MDDTKSFLLVGLIIFFSAGLATVTGFGANVLSYPLLLLLKNIYFIRPMLCLFGLFRNSFILSSHISHINYKAFFTAILCSSIGLPIGMLVYAHVNQRILMLGVGLFILYSATRGIITEFEIIPVHNYPRWLLYVVLFCSGFFQGAISTGGVFLVIYYTQILKDKKEFRATLSATAVVMVGFVALQLFVFVPQGIPKPGIEEFKYYMYIFPFLIVATLIGNSVAKKLPVTLFRRIIFVMMGLSGISLVVNALRAMFI